MGGVVVQEIVNPASGEGVVVVFVPESIGAPHRVVSAAADINDRYMMRTATSVVVMPHRHLADRFAARAAPQLQLIARLTAVSPATVEFRLPNLGRGAARRPAFQLVHDSSAFQEPMITGRASTTGFGMRQEALSTGRSRTLIEAREDVIVYPGMDLVAHRWQTRLAGPAFELTLHVVLYALDMQPIQGNGRLFMSAGEQEATVKARELVVPS